MDKSLEQFLSKTADSRIKLDVLGYFLRNAGSFLSTEDLAIRTGRDQEQVKKAVSDLNDAGILLYTPFGYSDICFLDGEKHTPEVTRSLEALHRMLENSPGELEAFLKSLEKGP